MTTPAAPVQKTSKVTPSITPPGGAGAHAPLADSGQAGGSGGLGATLNNRQLLLWMFRFFRPVKALAFIACVYVALLIGVEVFTTRQVGQVIDLVKSLEQATSTKALPGFWNWLVGTTGEARTLRWATLVLSGLIVATALLRYLREVQQMKLSMNMVYYIREGVYDKLQRVGFGFHDAMSTGQLINRALSDLQNVRSFLQTALLSVLEIVLVVCGYIALLITRSPWVAVLALLPLPIWTWYILRFSKKVQPVAKAVMEAGDKNIALITEAIAGVHVIKAFATETQEIGKYNGNCDTFFNRVRQRIRLFANFSPVIHSIASASHLLLYLALAIICLVVRTPRAGDFLILGGAMWAILSRLQQVAGINDAYQNAIVSAKRLHEVLAARPTVAEKPQAMALPEGCGALRFENVTFGYDSAKPVLKNVTFDAKPGSVVAIVGPTGAGKSSLVSLIARFYDPQQGRIVIDGVDLRDLTLDSLRTQVAFVFQETYLFSDTVENNIAYGRPHIRGGEIEAAARLAQAHEFIEELPKGYKTVLAERGSSLSGGQRQRLAIARVILQNPRILVLDDATAAVDPETEDLIRRGMRFVMHDRTTFVIAHRLSTVKQADQVIVLVDGEIAQVGTHAELMEQEGYYRNIAVVQLYGEDYERAEAQVESPSHMKRLRKEGAVAAATAGRREEPEPDAV